MVKRVMMKQLLRIVERVGLKKSGLLRYAFMEYAMRLSLITERVHGKT